MMVSLVKFSIVPSVFIVYCQEIIKSVLDTDIQISGSLICVQQNLIIKSVKINEIKLVSSISVANKCICTLSLRQQMPFESEGKLTQLSP